MPGGHDQYMRDHDIQITEPGDYFPQCDVCGSEENETRPTLAYFFPDFTLSPHDETINVCETCYEEYVPVHPARSLFN